MRIVLMDNCNNAHRVYIYTHMLTNTDIYKHTRLQEMELPPHCFGADDV